MALISSGSGVDHKSLPAETVGSDGLKPNLNGILLSKDMKQLFGFRNWNNRSKRKKGNKGG
jgi:hypothetical protein